MPVPHWAALQHVADEMWSEEVTAAKKTTIAARGARAREVPYRKAAEPGLASSRWGLFVTRGRPAVLARDGKIGTRQTIRPSSPG